MEINLLLDILKYTISGWLVIIVAYFLFKNKLFNTPNLKSVNKNGSVLKNTIVIKLQAFERIILFIERINPENIFIRLHYPGMLANEMQSLILAEIRAEYHHNITQQLYVSIDSWALIKRIKNDTINIVNVASQQLDPLASAIDLSKLVFSRLDLLDENPYNLAIKVIKNEMDDML